MCAGVQCAAIDSGLCVCVCVCVHASVRAECKSELCLGQTVCDIWGYSKKRKNVHVARSMDVGGFWKLFFTAVLRANSTSPLCVLPQAPASAQPQAKAKAAEKATTAAPKGGDDRTAKVSAAAAKPAPAAKKGGSAMSWS